jgi:hypothetical protein
VRVHDVHVAPQDWLGHGDVPRPGLAAL